MNTKLTTEQRAELQYRHGFEDEDTVYDYKCSCGQDMDEQDPDGDGYDYNGVHYPIITSYSNHEGDCSWYEYHRCTKCGNRVEFSNGN